MLMSHKNTIASKNIRENLNLFIDSLNFFFIVSIKLRKEDVYESIYFANKRLM